jgi:hypothetical protein
MLIQPSRPKRRNYTICLASTDANSYYSPSGTPWNAEYFVNLNSIMSQEEQARPYYVHFTFQSQAGVSISNPTATPPVQIFLDFQNNSYPHLFSNSQFKPVGFLKWIPDQSQTAPYPCYVESKTNDNEEVYINSLLGCNAISLHFMDLNGAMYTPTVPFICYIHLSPADF